MIKIAICGQAGSGKDTFTKMLEKNFFKRSLKNDPVKRAMKFAFADPVKKIASIMYPSKDEYFYGKSSNREKIINSNVISQKIKARDILKQIGDLGRKNDPDLWINLLDYNINTYVHPTEKMIIVTDCRFLNEFFYLRNKNFTLIKLKKNKNKDLHLSESEQNLIPENLFHFIVYNNNDLESLELKAKKIVKELKQ